MNSGWKIAVGAGAAALLLQWPYRNYQFGQMTEEGESSVSVPPPPPSLSGDGLHFVNFQTSWCGHCQKLAPTWAELEKSEGGSCTIVSIDCDRDKDVCKRYNVRGYPTLMLMMDGKRLVDYRGPRDLDHLRDFLRTNERALERVQAAEH